MLNKNIAFLDKVNEDVLCLSDSDYHDALAVMSKAETAMSIAISVTKEILAKARGKSEGRRLAIAASDSEGQMRRVQALAEISEARNMLDLLAKDIYPKFDPEIGLYLEKTLGARERALFLRIIDLQVFALYWSIFHESGQRQLLGDRTPIRVTFFGRKYSIEEVVGVAQTFVMRYTDNRFLYMKAKAPLSCLYVKCQWHGDKVVLCGFNDPDDIILHYALKPIDGTPVIVDGTFYVPVSNEDVLTQIDDYIAQIQSPGAKLYERILAGVFKKLLEEAYSGDLKKFKEDVYLEIAKILAFEGLMGKMKDLSMELLHETYSFPFYRQYVLDDNPDLTGEKFFAQFFEDRLNPLRERQLLLSFLFVPYIRFEKDQKTCFDVRHFRRLSQFVALFLVKGESNHWAIDWDNLWAKLYQIRAIIERKEGLELLNNDDIVRVAMEMLGIQEEERIGIRAFSNLIESGLLDVDNEFKIYWGFRSRQDAEKTYDSVPLYDEYFISLGLMSKQGDEVSLTLEGQLLVSGVSKPDRETISRELAEETQRDDLSVNQALKGKRVGVVKGKLDDNGSVKIGRGINNVYFDFGEPHANKDVLLILVNDKYFIYSPQDRKVFLSWSDRKALTDKEYLLPASPIIKQEEVVLGFTFPYKRDLVDSNYYDIARIVQSNTVSYAHLDPSVKLTYEIIDGDSFELDGNCVKISRGLLDRELTEQEKIELAVKLARILTPHLGDSWVLIIMGILEKNNYTKQLYDFIGEIEGIELEDKRVEESLQKNIIRIWLEKAVRKAFSKMGEIQTEKVRLLLVRQLNSTTGDVVYFSSSHGSEHMITEKAHEARVGKKVAVAKVFRSQLHFDYEGNLCISKNGDVGEELYVIYRDRDIVVLNHRGEDVSEDVRFKHVYQKLEEEGLTYLLDIFDDFTVLVNNLELLIILKKGLRKTVLKRDGIKEWLTSFGENFNEEYFASIEETILRKVIGAIDLNNIQKKPEAVIQIIDGLFQFFVSTIMYVAENNSKRINPVIFSAFIESLVETVLIKFNKDEIKDSNDIGIWLQNIWDSFNHLPHSSGERRYPYEIGRVWQFPNAYLEEKIYEFFSYFVGEESREIESAGDNGVKAVTEDSSRVVLFSKVRKGSKWLRAGDQHRVDLAFLASFESLHDQIEAMSVDAPKETYRRLAQRELRLLAEILMKLSSVKHHIAFVPMEVWGGEKVCILMDLFKTKTWVYISFGEEEGKDIFIRIRVKMGDLSLSFRIDYPPSGDVHFNIEGGNIIKFFGPHHDYGLKRAIPDKKAMRLVQQSLRTTLAP